MFNILTDDLPVSVSIDGQTYEIRWWFRAMIKIMIVLQDEVRDQTERRALALNMFYPVIPPDIAEAERQMFLFCIGDKPKNNAQKSAEARHEHAPALYSYEYDDGYIYAAFRQQYGINLQSVEGLHWFEFRAMLHGLTDDCQFSQVIGYRGMDLTKIKDPEMKRHYRELKERFELPLPPEVQAEEDQIKAILRGDGDLSKIGL